jgi:hypothetical protein
MARITRSSAAILMSMVTTRERRMFCRSGSGFVVYLAVTNAAPYWVKTSDGKQGNAQQGCEPTFDRCS